jgi:hypothetical protein
MGDKRAIYFLEGYDANKQLVYFGMTLYQNMNWTTKNVADTDISKQKRDIPPAAFAQQWEGANQKTWLLKGMICSLLPVRSCPPIVAACGYSFPCKYIDTDVTGQ